MDQHLRVGVPSVLCEPEIVTALVRCVVLIRYFDGDPDAWLALLPQDPQLLWAEEDRAFLRWLKERMREDATLLPRMGRIISAAEVLVDELPLRQVV